MKRIAILSILAFIILAGCSMGDHIEYVNYSVEGVLGATNADIKYVDDNGIMHTLTNEPLPFEKRYESFGEHAAYIEAKKTVDSMSNYIIVGIETNYIIRKRSGEGPNGTAIETVPYYRSEND